MPYQQQKVILIDEARRKLAIAKLENAPLGVECIVRAPVKVRQASQNSLYWAGPLTDIAEQAWVRGRQYSAEVWHEFAKREFLPEDNDPDLARQVRNPEQWHKWDMTPNGERVLVGSTTDLTVHGFGVYLEQVYAYGASCGVLFSTK